MVFSEQVFLAFTLNQYDNQNDINQAILNINYIGGQTNTPEALIVTREQCFSASNGDRRNSDNLAIMVTDGLPFPTNRRQPALDQARRLKNFGVFLVPVGITDTIDEDFLRDISSPPQVLGIFFCSVCYCEQLRRVRASN